MVRVLQDKNFFIVYSKLFLFFECKLEKSDLSELNNTLRSADFNVEENETSFLEIMVLTDGSMLFNFHNPKSLGNTSYVLFIFNKNDSYIHNTIASKDISNETEIDLFDSYSGWPSDTEYPVTIYCTARPSNSTLFKEICVTRENSMNKLSSDLRKILDEAYNTDVVLKTGGDSIKAHKIMLQARSPVFQKMFDHDSSEANKNEADIPDIDPATLRRLVHFMYTGNMEKCNSDEAAELFYAADKYELLTLREACKIELLINLNTKNACSIFTLACLHNDEDFKKEVVQFISANFTDVINTETFLEMSKEDMALLVRLSASDLKK